MILITTTRRPSQRTRSFVRDLYHVIPNAIRRNRGKMSLEDVNEVALKLGAERVLVVGTKRGNPSSLYFFRPTPMAMRPLSLIYLRGVTLRREIIKKRAPPPRGLCISCESEMLLELAKVFSLSLKAKEIGLSSLENLNKFDQECSTSLHLAPEKESNVLSAASFFSIIPLTEIGPRMRIGGFELFDGGSL